MNALEATTRRPAFRLPPELSLTGKLVYLYLTERGSASIEDLKEALSVPQIRLYPTLKSLERRGLVEQTGDQFTVPR